MIRKQLNLNVFEDHINGRFPRLTSGLKRAKQFPPYVNFVIEF